MSISKEFNLHVYGILIVRLKKIPKVYENAERIERFKKLRLTFSNSKR